MMAKITAKYRRLLELSGFGLICFPVVTVEVSSPSCATWWFFKREFFFSREVYNTVKAVFILLMRTQLLDSSSDISFSVTFRATFTSTGLFPSSFCCSFESRNTHSLESHQFNMLKMFLLKSQSDGFYSFGVLCRTSYSTIISQNEGNQDNDRTLQVHWPDVRDTCPHTDLLILFYSKG